MTIAAAPASTLPRASWVRYLSEAGPELFDRFESPELEDQATRIKARLVAVEAEIIARKLAALDYIARTWTRAEIEDAQRRAEADGLTPDPCWLVPGADPRPPGPAPATRCNCENSACSHKPKGSAGTSWIPCAEPADPTLLILDLGAVCAACYAGYEPRYRQPAPPAPEGAREPASPPPAMAIPCTVTGCVRHIRRDDGRHFADAGYDPPDTHRGTDGAIFIMNPPAPGEIQRWTSIAFIVARGSWVLFNPTATRPHAYYPTRTGDKTDKIPAWLTAQAMRDGWAAPFVLYSGNLDELDRAEDDGLSWFCRECRDYSPETATDCHFCGKPRAEMEISAEEAEQNEIMGGDYIVISDRAYRAHSVEAQAAIRSEPSAQGWANIYRGRGSSAAIVGRMSGEHRIRFPEDDTEETEAKEARRRQRQILRMLSTGPARWAAICASLPTEKPATLQRDLDALMDRRAVLSLPAGPQRTGRRQQQAPGRDHLLYSINPAPAALEDRIAAALDGQTLTTEGILQYLCTTPGAQNPAPKVRPLLHRLAGAGLLAHFETRGESGTKIDHWTLAEAPGPVPASRS